MLLSESRNLPFTSYIADLDGFTQNTRICRGIAEDYTELADALLAGRGGGLLCPPPSRREPSMWIRLERLSEARESLEVWLMREFIVEVRGEGGIALSPP